MRFFFDKTITVYRLIAKTGDKEDYQLNGTIYGSVVPIDAEASMLSEGNPAKSLNLYTYYSSDINKTDKVEINDIEYIVRGIRIFDRGSVNFKEAIIEEMES